MSEEHPTDGLVHGGCAVCGFEELTGAPQDAADVAECDPELLCAAHQAVAAAYARRLFGRRPAAGEG